MITSAAVAEYLREQGIPNPVVSGPSPAHGWGAVRVHHADDVLHTRSALLDHPDIQEIATSGADGHANPHGGGPSGDRVVVRFRARPNPLRTVSVPETSP